MSDQETLDVYNDKAEEYASRFSTGKGPGAHLLAFMNALPENAHVLDLGCGTGRHASFMIGAGFTVDAWDASQEMAAVAAERFGVDVSVTPFEALDAVEAYDGIFANFSLLHDPKSKMPDHLARIAKALKPGGLFMIGLKTGNGERRDNLGRFYAYYQDAELTKLLEGAGFEIKSRSFGAEEGLDGVLAPWIVVQATRP